MVHRHRLPHRHDAQHVDRDPITGLRLTPLCYPSFQRRTSRLHRTRRQHLDFNPDIVGAGSVSRNVGQNDMKKVFSAPSVIPCDLFRSVLHAAGIDSMFKNEGGSAITGNALPVPAGSELPWACGAGPSCARRCEGIY